MKKQGGLHLPIRETMAISSPHRAPLVFEPGASCWIKRLRTWGAVAGGMLFFPLLLVWPVGAPLFYLPALVAITLGLSIFGEQQETREKTALLQTFREPTDSLGEQAEANFRTSLIAYEMGQAIGREVDLKGILRSLLHILERRLAYDRGAVFLKGPDQRLTYQVGFGFKQLYIDLFSSYDLRLDFSDASTGTCAGRNAPGNKSRAFSAGTDAVPELFFKLGSESFVCCPISAAGEVVGMLYVDRFRSREAITELDVMLITGISPIVGLTIRNAELHVSRRARAEAPGNLPEVLDELRGTEAIRDLAAAEHDEVLAERGRLTEEIRRRFGGPLGEARTHAAAVRRAAGRAAPLIRKGAGGLGEGERLRVLRVIDSAIPESLASFKSSTGQFARHLDTLEQDAFSPTPQETANAGCIDAFRDCSLVSSAAAAAEGTP